MAIPWGMLGTLLRVLGPSIPDIVSTVKNLKTEQQREQAELNSAEARFAELEMSLNKQLMLMERLTSQVEQLEKAYRIVTFFAVFALVLAGIAIGIVVFK